LKLLDDGGVKAKARLVARGFEDAEQGLLTSSPTYVESIEKVDVGVPPRSKSEHLRVLVVEMSSSQTYCEVNFGGGDACSH